MSSSYTKEYTPKLSTDGLYDPSFEHEACGVGLVANIRGVKSHGVIKQGLEVLINLGHRGAAGADPETGDGAGIMMQMPHEFIDARSLEGSEYAGSRRRELRHRYDVPAAGR